MFPITEGKHRLKLVSFRGRFVSWQTHIKRVVGVGPAATFRNDKSTRRWRHLWGGNFGSVSNERHISKCIDNDTCHTPHFRGGGGWLKTILTLHVHVCYEFAKLMRRPH